MNATTKVLLDMADNLASVGDIDVVLSQAAQVYADPNVALYQMTEGFVRSHHI